MKIKGVLFDLDGTLVNTTPLILESFRHTFKQFGMPIPSDSELVAGFGLPMRTAVTAYMPDEMADEFCDAYRAYQRTRHDELIQGIDGVAETLSALKQSGIKMAVVTSKKRPAAIRDLGCYDLVEYFDTIIACDDCAENKPLPGPSLMALKRLGLNGADCLAVGDSPYDLQSARAAGCQTAAVRYTSFDWNFILNEGKPDYVLNKMTDLLTLIDTLNKQED